MSFVEPASRDGSTRAESGKYSSQLATEWYGADQSGQSAEVPYWQPLEDRPHSRVYRQGRNGDDNDPELIAIFSGDGTGVYLDELAETHYRTFMQSISGQQPAYSEEYSASYRPASRKESGYNEFEEYSESYRSEPRKQAQAYASSYRSESQGYENAFAAKDRDVISQSTYGEDRTAASRDSGAKGKKATWNWSNAMDGSP